MVYYTIEEIDALDELVAFRTGKGLICPDCWLESQAEKFMDILTAGNAAERAHSIRCKICGVSIWE